ncbi:MAG: uncharacterized protein A8A55_1743 [Amphiamblys sp. WSBS2006]|nr:MAG: uncharacterized protein A8A55_1743 [Amphiamblys sp. WSBS2006]
MLLEVSETQVRLRLFSFSSPDDSNQDRCQDSRPAFLNRLLLSQYHSQYHVFLLYSTFHGFLQIPDILYFFSREWVSAFRFSFPADLWTASSLSRPETRHVYDALGGFQQAFYCLRFLLQEGMFPISFS